MNNIRKYWLKYFAFVSLLGLFLNILYLSVPFYLMVVYDKVLFSFSVESLSTLSIGLLFVLLFVLLTDFIRRISAVIIADRMERKLAPQLIKKMFSLKKDGVIVYKRGLSDLKIISESLSEGRIVNYLDMLWVLVFLGVLFYINHILCFAAFSGFGICVIIYLIFRKYAGNRYVVSDIISSNMSGFVDYSIINQDIVSGLGLSDNIAKKYINSCDEGMKKKYEASKAKTLVSSIINFIALVSACLVFCIGTILYFYNEITVGAMLGVFFIALRIFYPAEKTIESAHDSIKSLAAYKRLKYYMSFTQNEPKFELPEPEGKIMFENVVYSLNGRPVLKNISFGLEAGESLVIIGSSGSGKTLLTRLAKGIINPTSGKIRIDGADISNWDKDELVKYSGYLPGEKMLFPGKISENIAGMASPDPDKVVEAAKTAFAHDMILKQQDGYDTEIIDNGYNLSSSQSQLLSVSRALYDNPKLVIMDSPHKDLDELSLKNFVNTMKILKEKKTTLIVVSDRPSIAVNADKIMVLKDGQISLFGNSKEVLTKLTNS